MKPLENEVSKDIPLEIVYNDRMRFIRNPLVVCVEISERNVLGGIWFGETTIKNNLKLGKFHLSFEKSSRKYAHSFLEYVEECFARSYDALCCAWGKRSESDNPLSFFQNKGYIVTENLWGGIASKMISHKNI